MSMIDKIVLNTRKDTSKTIEIQCNKCQNWVVAHKWSISGSGKKCNCGNMIYRHMSTDMYFSRKK